MVAKSFAGLARVQASYEVEPNALARATYSAGTLIAFSKSRLATRIRLASSESCGRPPAWGSSASSSFPSCGSTDFSCASLLRVALWRARAPAPLRHVGCMIPAEQRARGVEVADLAQAMLELRELGLCRLSMAQAPAGFSPAFSRAHAGMALAGLDPG